MQLFAQTGFKKSDYDIIPAMEKGMAGTVPTYPTGLRLINSVVEATLLKGGFYTLGTSGGVSTSRLDDNCSLTYGHPYARTSYPVLHIDGEWNTLDAFFVPDSMTGTETADSISIRYVKESKYEFFFSVKFTQGNIFTLSSSLKNLDTVSHSFGLGLVFDPSLGKRGDGWLRLYDQTILNQDTSLDRSAMENKNIDIVERSSKLAGIKLHLDYPSGTPDKLILANWEDMVANHGSNFSASTLRRIHDAVLKFLWLPVAVDAGQQVYRSVSFRLDQPDFGTTVFLRWDVPDYLDMEQGKMYPREFPTVVTTSSSSSSLRLNTRVQLVGGKEIYSSTPTVAISSIGPLGTEYVKLPLLSREIYENKIVDLVVTYAEGATVVDSLVRPVLIPATPVSDTGLIVTIDSLIVSAYPKVTALFKVQRKATKEYIYDLREENVYAVENESRISNYYFGKDTIGSSNNVDIVFVLDVTGSMMDEIEGVKTNIKEFSDSLRARGLDYRLGMVTFLDIIENVYAFTPDVQVFKGYVNAQSAHGGGDLPENSLDALYRASEMPFRDNANRIIIWITDATYHEKNSITSRVKMDVVNRMLSLDITVNAIGTKGFETDWYKPIVEPTGGNYYDIAGNFRDILLDIGKLKGTSRYMLSYNSVSGATGSKTLKLFIHYAGLGGDTSAVYSFGSGSASLAKLDFYPNPFNSQINVRLRTPAGSHGAIEIYNLLGQRVQTFVIDRQNEPVSVFWNGKDHTGVTVPSGIYFVRAQFFDTQNRLSINDVAKIIYLK
jgi:Mg-chelatase subunit ChlD